jgi:eukaryotic-like serine/threonine-protein kinase
MQCPRCGGDTPTLSLCFPCRAVLSASTTSFTGVSGTALTGLTASTGTLAAATMAAPAAFKASVDAGPLEAGQSFGARYHIIRLLGAGGMGAVYHAWDAELQVSVAIKIIRPEIMADSRTAAEVERRFKRELLLARQVTHKNVVRIHDLGEIDGIKYITMPFVDGIDLATLLKHQNKLPVPTVVRLARAVVSGLVAAHTAGVVHRDLKPANIMIGADGDAVIMDFGIARSSGTGGASPNAAMPAHLRADLDGGVTVAAAGATRGIVGTVEYMAPEQASGRDVDQRADIYSFGLILYDALVGIGRSARAESPVAELRARMKAALPPARSVEPAVPEAIDALVSRCLDPDPEKRYQTTSDLEIDLNRLDEAGEPIPVKRVVGVKIFAGVIALALALIGGSIWYARTLAPDVPHDQVSVVIADIQNLTGDPTFDRVLEPTLKRVLEGASFISAYDHAGINGALGVRPPEKLDAAAASAIAAKQGLGLVLSGTIDRQGSGYGISISAAQVATGKVVATERSKASTKDQVVETTTKLATAVRRALGDDTSDSAKLFAMNTLSAGSLEVVRQHAAGMEALSNSKYEDALQSFSKAVELDRNFGMGYQGMAAAARNLGRLSDANKHIAEALNHLNTMTERERFGTRGLSYRLKGDYQKCVKEYGDLVARYAADTVALNQLALCSTQLRDMNGALDAQRRALKIMPRRTTVRTNLAFYESYATHFQAGEREARAVQEPVLAGVLALAFAQLGQGQVAQAVETYTKLEALNTHAASSRAQLGLGDVAIYEGRFSQAARILSQGAADDVASKDPDAAADKFAALAYARLTHGDKKLAVTAADQALANSHAVKIRFLAARVLAEAGETARATKLAEELGTEYQVEPQVYAKIIEGNIARGRGELPRAITALTDANKLLDTWIGHFELGRAYLALAAKNTQAYLDAEAEFDRCINRRGEALALFLDERPTYGHLPPVYYYQGLVQEGMKNAGFEQSYRAYLDIRGGSVEDPLLSAIRRRVER